MLIMIGNVDTMWTSNIESTLDVSKMTQKGIGKNKVGFESDYVHISWELFKLQNQCVASSSQEVYGWE